MSANPLTQITAYKWWEDLGTMGLTAHLTSGSGGPSFSSANAARFRVRSAAGVVVHWPAAVVSSTATTAKVRHLFVPGDLAVGKFQIFGEVSIDGGTTYYVQRTPVELVVSG